MEPVVIYTSRRKALVTAAAAVTMTALSGFLAFGLIEPFARVVGWIGLGFFGLALVIVFLDWLRPKPVLVLDAQGVEVRASAFGRVRIAWEEIDHLIVRRVSGQRMLGIVPKDVNRWLAMHSPVASLLARANSSFGAPFWVAESTLPGTCADLAEFIRRYRPVEVVWLD